MVSTTQATVKGSPRGDRTRLAIREAAVACFSEAGYDATTTVEIARRAGVSEATVFNHFTSKAGLLRVVMQEFYDLLQAETEDAAAAPGSAAERFRGLIDRWASRVERDWGLVAAFGQQARYGTDADLTAAFVELNRHFTRVHLEVIEELRTEGALASDLPGPLVRDLLFGTLEHTALSQVAAGRAIRLRPAARRLADLLLLGPVGDDALTELQRQVAAIGAHLGVA